MKCQEAARGSSSAKQDAPGAEGDSNLTNMGLSARARRDSFGAVIATMQVCNNKEGPRATLKPGPRDKVQHPHSPAKGRQKGQEPELKCSPWLMAGGVGGWEQAPGEAGQGD